MGRLIDADEYEKRIKPYDTEDVMDKALYNFAHEKLITTPTAQPEHLSDDDFETIRIHLSALMWELWNQGRVKEAKDYQALIDRFMAFATEPHDIIRCKDCENFQTDWEPYGSDGYYCAVMDIVMEEDGFCSHAERKDDAFNSRNKTC